MSWLKKDSESSRVLGCDMYQDGCALAVVDEAVIDVFKSPPSRRPPIMIVVIGVLVAVLALGVFLPLWDLSSAARGG